MAAGVPKANLTKKKKGSGAKASGAKKAKTYRLSESKIAAARQILGVATATAAIEMALEMALDMVIFRQELVDGTARMLGVRIASFDAL